MRNFDNWTCYRDLKGNILRGCVQFNVKGGNTPAPIFDRNGTAIANPQITDILGRTQHQVFIDEDVTAYFYKYVGDGTIAAEEAQGIDTSDVSRWALQFTCDNVLAFGSSFDSLSAMEIGTMSALRAIDPESVPNVGGVKEIILGGYYEAGDCAQVRYIWDAESVDADDNGSVIKCDDVATGRWILITPTKYCDSRHFGIFPQNSALADVDHTTRIGQLVDYCNEKSIDPLFNGSVSYPYFIYSYLNVSSRNTIIVSYGTKFVDKQNSNFFGDFEGNPKFVNGKTIVKSDKIKASWNFKDATGYREVDIDGSCTKTSFDNARVIVTVATQGKSFTNCEIVSDGKLGNNTFSNCVLRGSMFSDAATAVVIDDACVLHASDFHWKMALWCSMKVQQSGTVIDAEMETLDSSCAISRDGLHFKDAIFDGFVYSATSLVDIESCRGSLTIAALGNYVITIEDSELNATFSNTGEVGVGMQPTLNARNSTISFVNNLTYFLAFGAVSSAFTGNSVLVNGDVALDGCNVAILMTIRGKYTARNSTLSRDILHYTVNATAEIEMENNVLNGVYNLVPAVANTVVHGSWTDNYSSVTDPVRLFRFNIDPVDSHHEYTYKGNSGTFIPDRAKVKEFVSTVKYIDGSTQTWDVCEGDKILFRGKFSGLIYIGNRTVPFDTVQLFRIGTDRAMVNVKLLAYSANFFNGNPDAVYNDCPAAAVHIDGNTWGIYPYFDDPSTPADTMIYPPILFRYMNKLSFSDPTPSDYTESVRVVYEMM